MDTSVTTQQVFRKIALRITPFLFLCYILNFIDRVNIGFAKLQFLHDLGMSEAVFGAATGFFFVAYAAFELPSNLMLAKAGARATLMRIMVLWGLATVAQVFVQGPNSLYVLRFLLGAAEAGFFPGIILYLSYWFPDARRARINSILLLAVPIAGMTGGPLSGIIMSSMNDLGGLRGWQWLFIVEGVPALILGLLAPLMLSNRPEQAAWLSDAERRLVASELAASHPSTGEHASGELREIFRNPRFIGLAAIYFCVYVGLVGVTFWTPSIMKASGITSISMIGWLAGLISVVTMIGNLAIGFSSDRRLERRWHVGGCLLATAVSLAALRYAVGHTVATVALLAIAQTAMFTVPIVFWTIPAKLFQGRQAAGGIALISTVGSLGGTFASWLVGTMTAHSGTPYNGMVVVAAFLIGGAALLLRLVPRQDRLDRDSLNLSVHWRFERDSSYRSESAVLIVARDSIHVATRPNIRTRSDFSVLPFSIFGEPIDRTQ
ncbi:MFS transporter [Burkholderia gladioli]|uniref:Major facilitator superfamily (MFS) profile domain-containing protein n=1 Tax=Burkholderia gladioli (strain BSR3) TaxID=999541 RepID=F2LCB3_BURGS|nr:MFS transporter [Burkholderia gladioli]AEA60165.1 hypothetical protein bgla_1g15060 [Burkholderia gladioli BSR3]MBW5287255.1 MFS transporter [Burkholderia gladioli]